MPWIRKRTGRTFRRAGYQGRMKIYKGARVTWAGRRTSGRTSVPRSVRTGSAVTKHVIRLQADQAVDFTGNPDKLVVFQPLASFVASGQYTSYIKKQYEEFRIIKASMRMIPRGGDATFILQNGDGLLNSVSWDRNSKYAGMLNPTVQTVQEDPDTKYALWNTAQQNILYTSIVADRTKEWLSTEVAPGQAPNTGDFFCPGLYWYLQVRAAVAETFLTTIIMELIIETRGFINPR